MNVILQCFFQYEGEMRRLRAIAIGVLAIILEALHCVVESRLYETNVFADAWKVSELERGAVLLDDIHQRHVVEEQLVLPNFELFLGELKGLFNEFAVTLHLLSLGLKGAILE